jgi:SGNH domain (fused to AT3 domains)
VPELAYQVPATLLRARRGLSELPPVWRRDFERRQRLVLAALADVAAAGGALVLYPHTVLCDGATCAVADGVRPLDSDDDHLSAFGAERVARTLAPRLLKSLGSCRRLRFAVTAPAQRHCRRRPPKRHVPGHEAHDFG